jgi:parallel beta-helix repeat protein
LSKKTAAVAILAFLMVSIFSITFHLKPVKASGTIYIRADGSIEPADGRISTADGVTYYFTDNISDSLVVQRSYIVIDGRGFAVQGSNNTGTGIELDDVVNVTILSAIIKDFEYGIRLLRADLASISGCAIMANSYGISADSCVGGIVSVNSIMDSGVVGVQLSNSSYNVICKNDVTTNNYGIQIENSSDNKFFHNNFLHNSVQVSIPLSDSSNVWDNGYPSCGNYWSDYSGTDSLSGPGQNEAGSDGVGDWFYFIDGANGDPYPLMNPWTPSFTVLDHMVIANQNAPKTLDPARCYDLASFEFIMNVYEPLIFFDEEKTDQFVPCLATDWTISPDGLTYTFTVRQGVKFQNNETLTAEDVEYSLERMLVTEGGEAWGFYEALFDSYGSRDAEGHFNITGLQIDSAITRDGNRVTLHLARPYVPLMQVLSQPWSSILCKKWCTELGDWPGTWNNWTLYNKPAITAIEAQNDTLPPGPHVNAMCGTGPYMLDYYYKDFKWGLIRFDGYWGGWPAPGSDGSLKRVTGEIIDNWQLRRDLLLDGQLDYAQLPKDATGGVLGQSGIRCDYPLEELSCNAMFFTFNISASSPYTGVLGGLPEGRFNQSGIPLDFFSDINVRKGFAYAFNYSKLIEEALFGEAYQPATPILPETSYFNPGQEKYGTSLEKAADCFAAAWSGQVWTNGFNLTICYNQGDSVRKQTCEIIKQNVESLNALFHIEIQELPLNFYNNMTQEHMIPVFQRRWLADFADPHDFAFPFMYSGGFFPSCQNYHNEIMDMLVQDGIRTSNETWRRMSYYELQMLYHEDCPSVPLYQMLQRRFERDWVQGWYYNPLLREANYFRVQWKGSGHASTRYSWPMFQQNVKHTGYSESPAPNTNQTRWTFMIGGCVYSAAVVDGRVYVGSSDKNVYCLDALTGKQIWNQITGDIVNSCPAVADGRVYVGSYDGKIYCLFASTGEYAWNYTTGNSVFSSPTVADGKVYVGSGDGRIYCLDAFTGTHIWNFTTGDYVLSSPAVVNGKVYVGSDDNKTYCFDALTGVQIWNFTTGDFVVSSPAVVDGRVYVGSEDGNVYCLACSTGECLWNYTTGGPVSSSPAVASGRVYVGSGDNRIYCLDAYTGAHIWNYTTGYFVTSSPAIADGKVYVGSYDHKVYCLDASDGVCVWSYVTGDWVHGSPAVADGMVFVGSDDGNIYALGNIVKSEDYETVQKAIDAAPPGATVKIAPGICKESLVVNKTLTILGEKGSAPVFDGGGSGTAITLLPGASGSIIANIVLTHWDQGILMVDSGNCKIYDNIMSLINFNGITLLGSNAVNNLIYNNIFQSDTVAINLTSSATGNTIYGNIIKLNNVGLNLESGGNGIYANTIAENLLGINMSNSNGNVIYHNNFVNNNVQILISVSTGNAWDDGYPSGGNYWTMGVCVDLCGGQGQKEPGSDGINDTGYTVAVGNVDRYPLVKPYSGSRDIGIAEAILSKTVVGQGFVLDVSCRITNYGTFNEIFVTITYASSLIVHMEVIGLTPRNSTAITVHVDTSGIAKGGYAVRVTVGTVEDENDTADNDVMVGIVYVGIPGDINGDTVVDSTDLGLMGGAWGSFKGDLSYNPNADIDGSETVDSTDLGIMGGHWGEMEP